MIGGGNSIAGKMEKIGDLIVYRQKFLHLPWRFDLCVLKTALSRCGTIDANDLVDNRAHAAAVAARHVSMAEARKARCVLAEMRWR